MVTVGDRVQLRERPWRVLNRQALSDETTILELEALDSEAPRLLSVVTPPDECEILPTEALQFDLQGVDAFASWACAHRLLVTTLVQETALLTGARFGRVALEAYQLAPTLRLLSKPRPSLLVADDVGLGKTIEAGIALLELAARGRVRRVLIVTPPGLLLQWQEELLEKFGLEFTLIENAAGLARTQSDLPAGVSPWDALPRVLTSVDFLKKETVRNRALRKRWDLIIVDEAHGLGETGTSQNPYRTQRTRLGIALRDNGGGLLLLTATPHNGYMHSFRSLIELVEPTGAVFRGSQHDLVRRVSNAMVRRMKPQIMRRRSDGTDEPVFPKRLVRGVPVPLLEKESELLHKVATYCSRTARSAEGTEDVELVSFAMQIVKKRALSSRQALEITIDNRLRALRRQEEQESPPTPTEVRDLQADLPLDEASAERTALRIVRSAIPKEEKRRKAETRALNGIRRVLHSLSGVDAKIRALLNEVKRALDRNPNDKVIIFTEYLDTLEAIHTHLEGSDELSARSVVLRGGLSGLQRLRVQERFEQPDTKILLATDAASEGLNLQRFCRRVIHFELPWNPNRLEQRNGRVDRYGQDRNCEIRYLYYPDSPEDDILHRIVEKIEHIQEAHVSTPDILGILQGVEEVDRGLVALDSEASNIEAKKSSLVRLFEDRTAQFVRNVQPLIAVGGSDPAEMQRIVDLLNTAQPLHPDDEELEQLSREVLGPGAFRETGTEHTFRIEVPVRYRDVGVQPTYLAATFRRSVAVKHRAADIEFITPRHPLVQALAADARRRLLQVFPGAAGFLPRRMAARRVAASEPTSMVFTFLGTISGGGGLLEEKILLVHLTPDLHMIGNQDEVLHHIGTDKRPGEVQPETLRRIFEGSFQAMAEKAEECAHRLLVDRAQALRDRRKDQAAILRKDLVVDIKDRLKEITEEERRARGLIDEATGQLRLFGSQLPKASGFATRRTAIEFQAEQRQNEIAEFEEVREPNGPRPLGALFLVPEGVS